MSPTWSFKKGPEPQEGVTNGVLPTPLGIMKAWGWGAPDPFPLDWPFAGAGRSRFELPLAACSGSFLPTHPRSQYCGSTL